MKKKYILMLFFMGSFGYAQWSSDPTTNTTVTNANSAANNDPISVSDDQGGIITAWLDIRNNLSYDIYAQRLNASGIHQWANNGVPICVKSGNQAFGAQQTNKTIISDGFGGAIICWRDISNGIDNPQIYAQRIDAGGNILWPTNGVLIAIFNNAEFDSTNPNLTTDGFGGAIITWADQRNGFFPNQRIYAQRINASGTIQWAANGIPINTTFSALPKIISDGNGGAIVAWVDTRTFTANNVYAQRINSSGNVLWAADGVPVFNVNPQNNFDIEIISDGMEGAIIAWSDDRNTSDYGCYAQRISASGDVLWSQNGVTVNDAINDQTDLRMATDGLHGAIFTWSDQRSDAGDIYAQRINQSGVLEWENNGILICNAGDSQNVTNFQYEPNIVSDINNGAIINWSDTRAMAFDSNIYAQKITSNGTIQWTPNGGIVCNNDETQYGNEIVSDTNGGAIVVWQDQRNNTAPNANVYAQNICANGQLGGDCALNIPENNFKQFTVAPNPTRSILNLQLANNQVVDKIVVRDLTGKRLIVEMVNGNQVNVEDLAAGVYVIEVYLNGERFENKFVKR